MYMHYVQEINPCPSDWATQFKLTDFYQHIAKDYNHVISSHKEMTVLKAALHHTVYETGRRFCDQYGILDATPYYYILSLLDINPEKIVDLGCGDNVFSKTIPGLVGIDADPKSKCDIHDFFDQDFVTGHKEFCDALITINTIHFSSLDTITQRLNWCQQLLKPGGRAFVSFNIETWLMHTTTQRCQELFGPWPRVEDVIAFVDRAVTDADLKLLIYDFPISRVSAVSSIRDDYNGNIRLVFQK